MFMYIFAKPVTMNEKIYEDPALGRVLLRKSMGSRRISIRVHPVKGVTVGIPFHLRYDDGLSFFMSKRDWVISVVGRQREKMADAELSGKAVTVIMDGTVVKTLLSCIVFSRVADSGSRESSRKVIYVESSVVEDVRSSGRLYLNLEMPISRKEVRYPDSTPEEGSRELSDMLSGALVKILRAEAKVILPSKLEFLASRYGFSYKAVAIKHNSSNWGSCSSRGNINLNLNLVRLPEPVCDYVLLHELCHLRHPDHGRDFHALLEKLCADNMTRLSLLGDPFINELLPSMKRSRAEFPVHHVLEREVKKYRLL